MNENETHIRTKEKAMNLLQKLYRSRVKIRKGDTSVLNVSVLFAGLCLLLAPHMTIAGIIVSMILGYQFSFTGMDPDFSSESLEKMVRSAAQNAKASVSSVVHTISSENRDQEKKPAESSARKNAPVSKQNHSEPDQNASDDFSYGTESLRQQAKELEDTMDSFFDQNPDQINKNSAYSAAASSVPTIHVPVQTETRDGELTSEEDQDGYSSVTIG